MDSMKDPPKPPQWGADGYRSERCARCGEQIGYAFFDARVYGPMSDDGYVTTFTHRDRDTYAFICALQI